MCGYRAITRNEELYPEPEQFIPERFWGKMNSDAAHQVDAVFGFGRRACPGKAFAESSIFLIMSNIIATMDFTKAVDEAGVPITPPVEYTKGFIRWVSGKLASSLVTGVHQTTRHVVPFKYKLQYRSPKARSIVEQANLLHN